MSRSYDTRTTTFSPEGRLFQIEYALEAINRAGTCTAIVCSDGIIMASEKRNFSELLDDMGPEKIYKINNDICCCVAGVTSDANVIIQIMRESAQRYYKTYQEPIPIEQLVTSVCDVKQQYTQLGGFRPFGVSILYIGWDKIYGYQLYQSDPSGNYSGWHATCIGLNNNKAIQKLKQDFTQTMTVEDAKVLIVQIMQEALETDYLSSKNLEVAIFKRNNDQSNYHIFKPEEILELPGNKIESSDSTEAL